ncbi:hypothetical protein PsorP6_003625 [Peronosclerospora sorghi]|uniref:Uncharacterized protein n=1 Tax=Peronosclerospora sorghi TaxID=230839 RepID=A0ACC0VNV1_9STRA|nr:hypothetical protein PsorP6_003625 [Peronosclerospora sorghi]
MTSVVMTSWILRTRKLLHLKNCWYVTKGKLVPLLVAEIVRCPKSVELTVDDNLQYWYELSRGFILDPQSWNPSLLSHEPVQLKCSMNDTGHETKIDRVHGQRLAKRLDTQDHVQQLERQHDKIHIFFIERPSRERFI